MLTNNAIFISNPLFGHLSASSPTLITFVCLPHGAVSSLSPLFHPYVFMLEPSFRRCSAAHAPDELGQRCAMSMCVICMRYCPVADHEQGSPEFSHASHAWQRVSDHRASGYGRSERQATYRATGMESRYEPSVSLSSVYFLPG